MNKVILQGGRYHGRKFALVKLLPLIKYSFMGRHIRKYVLTNEKDISGHHIYRIEE